MFHFQDIRQAAADNYGYVTMATAAALGIKPVEMTRWVQSGRLEHPARGVYRLVDYPPSHIEPFVRAVISVGKDARIFGESVLGMLNLAPTNPTWIYIGTPHRIRRHMPTGIKLVKTNSSDRIANYDGVDSQPVADAIRSCRAHLLIERIVHATEEAFRQGYITAKEHASLVKENKNETSS